MHLHRAKYIPKGGPDGGDGGRGGHIILRANPQFWTLIHLKYRKNIKADDGEKGGAALMKGKNGTDIYLDVPVGTVVKDVIVNPKRSLREARKQVLETGIGTKSQLALKMRQGQLKQERRNDRRRIRADRERQTFELRQQKKHEKHRGH